MGPPVIPVVLAKVTQESVPVSLRVVGTVEASAIVQVRSQVGGELVRVGFTEGQNVAKDALLFEIDARPYQEALKQTEAAVARDRAQLKQAEAALARDVAQARNGEADAERNRELAKAGVIAKAQLDQVVTQAEVYRESAQASRAAIETARATLASELAAVDKAKLDIGYCTIHAPISGRTGNLLVNAGNLVKANDAALVVIHQIAPVYVNFSVPEQYLSTIRRMSAKRAMTVQVSLKDDPGRTAAGRVIVIDNAVDTATGTIRLKAAFANRDGLLWPGAFVTVVLDLETISNATVIPSEALQAGQQGQFVYVVKADMSAEARPVKAGHTFGGKTAIESGLAPGETLITEGQLRLFPGAKVKASAERP